MKKSMTIVIVYTVVGIVLFFAVGCFITFDGYCRSLELARSSDVSYLKGQHIFSIENEDEIVDFTLYGNELRIITINCETRMFGTAYYKVESKSIYDINKILGESESENEYNWETNKNLFSNTKILWCMVGVESNPCADNVNFFDFIYNGEGYRIYYRIE